MDQGTLIAGLLVLVFIVLGGVFAGTEIALVSLRDSQINELERQGGRGARVAAVARDPNRFLAAVQIGVTVAGFFSAAYGASAIAPDVAPLFEGLGLPEGASDTVALVVLTLVIAYLSLVLGELVPKRLALQRSAGVATMVGPPLDRFATAMRPMIWLLSVSTDAVVRLLGGDPSATSEEMSQEELRSLVGTHEGLPDEERQIVVDVFDAGDRTLSEVMRPRADITSVRIDDDVAAARETVRRNPYSRYPVIGENFDDVRGFLHVRDLLEVEPGARVEELVRPIPFLPSTNRLLPTLTQLRAEGAHIAVVVDEYGGTDGLVTLEDLVEELVGDIWDEYDVDPITVRDPERASWIDAGLTIEDFAETSGVELADGPYETAAGFVLARLGHLAEVGDTVPVGEHELVVAEVDGRRITRLSVRPLGETPTS
ncbi:hemolysin family protein [Nocardioides ferulae]|uniref:hemolysin family protein n=1 Tax=Nocardioides ferulae TaxID=2340821 RepID=UPI000EAC0151|nr:hemolysin family protein [Nocardioides ferulae]